MSTSEHRLLVVDDSREYRELLADMIGEIGYSVETARDGFEALARLKLGFDLVLLDARMPGLDGYEVLHRLREDPTYVDLPVILVTGLSAARVKEAAAQAGADKFLEKPVSLEDLRESCRALLGGKEEEKSAEAGTPEDIAGLEETVEELARAHRESYRAQVETIERLAIAAEYRDEGTGAHVRRIGRYCAMLGRKLHLSPGDVEVLQYASQLHDVGKIGIPDSILLKPGELNDDEWEIMKQHTVIGARILSGSSSRFLQAGKKIALSHQEKWDGNGYPRGLEGEEIPLYGRICAIADMFDALTAHRPYRDAMPTEEAREIMKQERGGHFDPELLDLFMDNYNEVLQILRCNEAAAIGGEK